MRVGNRPHNSTQLLETLFAFVTKINYVSDALSRVCVLLLEKQATLLASRRERHYVSVAVASLRASLRII
jgi:hypothetical protein